MFRSLVWPPSRCSTVKMPGVQQKSYKMHNIILQNSVQHKINALFFLNCRTNITSITLCLSALYNCFLTSYQSLGGSKKQIQSPVHCANTRPYETLRTVPPFYADKTACRRHPTKMEDHTPFRLSQTVYSTYLQLFSISEGRLLHPQPEDASYHGDPFNVVLK
jgi:hypothetical protein